MNKFTEKNPEDEIIEKLKDKGWSFIPADELEREGYDEPLLIKNLIRKIKEINSGIELADEDIKTVLNELKLRGTGSEGNKKILNYIKYGVPVKLKKEKIVRYIQLFDYGEIEKNEFIATRQAVYRGREDIRTDVMLYVNGIPLVNIELKNPASFSESWYDAYRQIKDYEGYVPELYKYVQIGIAAEQTAKYFPVVPWQKEDEVKINEWREREKEITDPVCAALEMLSKETLLDLIKNYIFHRIERGEETKVIARHMQYRASEKIVRRVLENLAGKEDKSRGLIWHWQGSGKTLTMIFAANKLYHRKELGNPTIFFIVDRLDLKDQLYREFHALDLVDSEIIGSINDLKSVLKHDQGKGKRGLMITLIHKFRPGELRELQKELQEYSKTGETVINRKNVILFLDEVHRSQYGIMAGQMKSIFKNAFFFAFTGTPISKKFRDTYREFSYPPGEKYMDRYFVTDSLEDGFTVKIVYLPRLEKEVHLKKEMLEVFLKEELDEIPEKARTNVEERVKKRLNPINVFLEDPGRIKIIAGDIKKHFNENIKGKYKAMVVAASRKACVQYKRALDTMLPEEYSEVVMTYNRDDVKLIKNYRDELIERYRGKDTDVIKKEIIENFNEEENPKILIVTDMLLTGFDAPILQAMYLDKPLKEHRLLQAIARTNRPYNDLKEAGLILDYVGILDEVANAFKKYSREEWKGTMYDMKYLTDEFNDLIDEVIEMLEGVPKDLPGKKTLLKAVEVLTQDEVKGKKFIENYKILRKIFELLGTDDVKLIRLENYIKISGIYSYYIKTVLSREPGYEKYARQYFNKTLKFVREATESYGLEEELPEVAFDESYLKRMEEKVKSKEERTANYVFTLNRYILVERHKDPVSETLADKVENILKLWREKTRDFERIYRECVSVLKEREKLVVRQKTLGFTNLEYSTLLALEKRSGEEEYIKSEVKELSDSLEKQMFPGWQSQKAAAKKMEKEIRRFAIRYVIKHNLGKDKIDGIHGDLIENLKKYGKAN